MNSSRPPLWVVVMSIMIVFGQERTTKRNGVIHSEARKLISKVTQTCDEEARKNINGISSESVN
jgi:hypothetical protein